MKKIYICLMGMILAFTGLFFSACTKSYENVKISASGSGLVDNSISLAVGESADIEFSVADMPKGASGKLFLSPSSNIISAQIIDYNEKQMTSTVKIQALAFGTCFLKVTTIEGGKNFEIEIKISLAVEDFSLKDDMNLFAVKGDNYPKKLILSSSFFNFTPHNTSQTQIEFYDGSGNKISEIDPKTIDTDSVTITAKSPFLQKTIDFDVQIIDEISSVEIYEENEHLYSKEQNSISTQYKDLYFISNRKEFARKTLKNVINSGDNSKIRIERKVISNSVVQCSEFDISKSYLENNNIIFDFDLQSLNSGKTTIEFKIYYYGFEEYAVYRTFDLIVEQAPNEIRLNDSDLPSEQVLFDGAYSTVKSVQNISIFPYNSIFDKIEVVATLEEGLSGNVNDYINFTLAGISIFENENTAQITNTSFPVIARGIKQTNGKKITLSFNLIWGEQQGINNQDEISTSISYIVKTGANALALQDKYNSKDGLFISLEEGPKVFKGFYVNDQNAFIENCSIYCLSNQADTIEINQLQDEIINSNKHMVLNFIPKKAGESTWRIVLPNGVFRDFKVTVIEKLQALKLDVDESNSSYLSDKTYLGDNLTDVDVRLSLENDSYNANLQLILKTEPENYNLSNPLLYSLNFSKAQDEGAKIELDEKNLFVTIACDKAGFKGKVLDYSILVKVVNDFVLEVPDVNQENYNENYFEGSLNVRAYVPLEGVEFEKKSIALYSEGDLGYYYKDLSKTDNKLFSLTKDIELLNDTNITIELSASKPSNYNVGEKILYINNLGSYNLSSGEFILNYSGKDLPEEFYIYANVNYFNENYTAAFKVVPQKYIQVSEVRLSNYLQQIYLSPTHQNVDLYTYILPLDAVHNDLIFIFEPTSNSSSNIVGIESLNNNGVRLSYSNNGGGTGNLIIIPKSSISNSIENPNNSLKIPVIVGDGSENAPFIISTAEELLNISKFGLDKHYLITSKIDLSAINFAPLGEFSGSINGLGQGSIVGLNINNSKEIDGTSYGGLFTKIAKEGKISNLTLSGKIEIELKNKAKIGFLAGENNGEIQNIHVELLNSNVKVSTSNELLIGGIVGENNGKIQTNIGGNYQYLEKQYEYNNFNLFSLQDSVLKVSYAMQGKQTRSYIGGVAGKNNGNIERVENFYTKLYNNENYYIITNISVIGEKNVPNSAENTCFAIGAIAGQNSADGNIFAQADVLDEKNYSNYLKVLGKIEVANQAYNYLGGILGINSGKLDRIVSRVKVKSLGEVTDASKDAYLAGLVAFSENNASIINSVLQNIDDATSLGNDLSLIYSKNFGLNITGNGTDDDPYIVSKNPKVQVFGTSENGGEIEDATLKSETYITREYVEPNTASNYDNYYGDLLLGGADRFYQEKFEMQDTQLLVEHVTINGKTPYALNCDNADAPKMAYAYYYQAKNSIDQEKLNNLNIQELPFSVDGEVTLISFDKNIVSITNNGLLSINGTGIVRIKVVSNLNQKNSVDVLVYVVRKIDDYSLYLTSSQTQDNLLTLGKTITIYEGQNLPVTLQTKASEVVLNGYSIEIISGNEIVIFDDSQNDSAHVQFNKIGENLYLLEAIGDAGMQNFSLNAKYSVFFNNNYYSNEKLYDNNLIFNVEHKKGAEKITSKVEAFNNIEPNDTFEIEVEVLTDDFNENLDIFSVKVDENYKKDNYFNVTEKNRKYEISVANNYKEKSKFILTLTSDDISREIYLFTDNGKLFLSEINLDNAPEVYYNSQIINIYDLFKQVYKKEIQFELKNDNNEIINLNEILKLNKINYFYEAKFNDNFNENYKGQYFINFRAKNNCEYGLEVNLTKQSLEKILINSYELFDKEGNLQIGGGNSTNNYLSPNDPNFLKIEFAPLNSEFDYAEIKWNSDNSQLNAIMSWIDRGWVW